jgi:SNF2 family DNA or RNA helicase
MYHGSGKERQTLDAIADSDIVITTYTTLATELNDKLSLINRIGWFRVVLDHGARDTSFVFVLISLSFPPRKLITDE